MLLRRDLKDETFRGGRSVAHLDISYEALDDSVGPFTNKGAVRLN